MKAKITTLVIALFLAGCASVNSLNEHDRSSIRSVKLVVQEHRDMTLVMYATGSDLEQIGTLLFTGSISTTPSSRSLTATEALRQHLVKHNIVIKDIVTIEVARQLQSMGFKLVDSGEDAVIKIEIGAYGFNQAKPLSSDLKGSVWLFGHILRPDGKPIAQNRNNYCGVFAGFKSHTPQEILTDPSIARDQFSQCSAMAFTSIAKGYGLTR